MYRLERIKRLNKLKPKTLREINDAIFQFKSLFRSINRLYTDAGMELIKTEDELLENDQKKMLLQQNELLLNHQEDRSISGDNILKNTSNTAINTAQTNMILNDLNKNTLDGNKYQLISNKFQVMNFIRAIDQEQQFRNWAGLDDYTQNLSEQKMIKSRGIE